MKKAISLMIFLLLAFMAQAELVDDFDGYQTGAINTVTTNWIGEADGTANPSTSKASIAVDPADAGNKVIQLTEGGGTGQQWVRSTLATAACINEGTTGTLFVRFKATASIDSSFGLTDFDTASNDWNHFRVQIAIVNGSIRIRDVGTTRTLAYAATPATQIALNTDWYYLWAVVDNAANNTKLYLNQTGAAATEADRLVTLNNAALNTFGFRSAADTLDRFFWRAQNGAVDRILMLDNINITAGTSLSIPAMTKPYSPSFNQAASGTSVNVTFNWKAGADPAKIYAVNPAIEEQYVFVGTMADTTLYYKGKLGDPGTTDPVSQLTLTGFAYDTTYRWAVVEGLTGYLENLTADQPITVVDPNNIIGPTWTFASLTSTPVVLQQPGDVRVQTTENVVITCQYSNYSQTKNVVEWYKSGTPTPLVSGGDITITTGGSNGIYTTTLQIATPVDADQGDYSCTIDNGTPLVNSEAATLVVNKLLAQYDFENNLAPAVGSVAGAPTGQGKLAPADANSLKSVNDALSFTTGLNGVGLAVQLDPNEYIDFGTGGYPKASLLTGSVGNGLDAGTILCWVKPVAANHRIAVLANYNLDITTGLGFTIEANQDLRINARGEATEILTAQARPNRPEYDIFDGEWHMVGVVWDAQAQYSALYVDGQWVTNDSSMGTPTAYAAWQRGVLVGAGRQGSPNRHLLTDFFGGAIDKLRIYNYGKTADEIATEYYQATGVLPCTNMTFEGNAYNFDNAGSSYCKIDLADFAELARGWLKSGLYSDLPAN